MNKKPTLTKSGKITKSPFERTQIQVEEIVGHFEDETDPWRIFRIMTEFVSGFDFLRQYKKAVTIFGSARFKSDHPSYQSAERLSKLLVKEGFAVVTGGGPGIMEAANKGAGDAQGYSVGLGVTLPSEQKINDFVNHSHTFKYFFTRKVMLVYSSQAYVFFPGGFGTLDEFFELVTLVQTKKITPVPIVLVGKSFWTPLLHWVDEVLLKEYNSVSKADTELYKLVDTPEQAHKLIKQLLKANGKHTKTLQYTHKKSR